MVSGVITVTQYAKENVEHAKPVFALYIPPHREGLFSQQRSRRRDEVVCQDVIQGWDTAAQLMMQEIEGL